MHPKETEVEYVTDIIISADDAKKLEGLDVKVIQNSIINGKEYENVFEVNRKQPRPTQNYDRSYVTEFTTEVPSRQSRYIQSAPSNGYRKTDNDITVTTTVEKVNCPESQGNQRFYRSNANNYNTISSGWHNDLDTQPLGHVDRIQPATDVSLQFSRPSNAPRAESEFFHEVKITHDNGGRPAQYYDNYGTNRNQQKNVTYNDYVNYKYNKCLEGHKNLSNNNYASNDYSAGGMSRSRSIPVTYVRGDQNARRDWEDREQMANNNYKNYYLKQETMTETIRDRGLNNSVHGLSNIPDCDSYIQQHVPQFFNNCSDFLQANNSVSTQPSTGGYANNGQGNSFVTKTKKILETTRVVTTKKKSNWFNTHM